MSDKESERMIGGLGKVEWKKAMGESRNIKQLKYSEKRRNTMIFEGMESWRVHVPHLQLESC